MADNFRSAPEIIESCNCLFRDLLGTDPQKAVMAQDLVPHQKATQKPILAIIDQEDGTFADAQRAEAQWVAQKIDAIVKVMRNWGMGTLPFSYRPSGLLSLMPQLLQRPIFPIP